MHTAKSLYGLMEGGQETEKCCVENMWRKKSKTQDINEFVWDVNKAN